jgi:hypothetical protein
LCIEKIEKAGKASFFNFYLGFKEAQSAVIDVMWNFSKAITFSLPCSGEKNKKII